jgi:hypothetical protein
MNIMTNSSALGAITSTTEVTNISGHGIWLLSHGREMFLSYEDFPWFAEVPLRMVTNVQEPSPGHFYWPDLDVDLCQDAILYPDRFPKKAKTNSLQKFAK